MAELETINKLFLELSQFTTATSAKELQLEARLREVKSWVEAEECRAITVGGEDFWAIPRSVYNELRRTLGEQMDKCPNCRRNLDLGEQVYSCDVCGKDCCTACSDTTEKYEVLCDRPHG